MFDFTKLLHASIQLDEQITQDKQIVWTREESLRNAYVSLDVELAEVANTSEWFKVWKTHRGKKDPDKTARETLLVEYVDALDFILLISAKQQWTHLIVLDRNGIEQITTKPKGDLTKEYLALKKMFFGSYFDHRQDDFRHAWHLFLKMGLVEFGFTEDEIMTEYENKSKINHQRQANNY